MENLYLNLLNIWMDVGLVVKTVIAILAFASLVSWIIIVRTFILGIIIRKNNKNFYLIYNEADSLKDVLEKSTSFPFSPFKQMFIEGYSELGRIKDCYKDENKRVVLLQGHFQSYGLIAIERALKKGAIDANAITDKYLSTLANIGSIAPFIGIFGTVWGIIDNLRYVTSSSSTFAAVAPGIAESLVAAAFGLVVSIPAVWFYNNFSDTNLHLNSNMKGFGQQFLNVVERSLIISK